FEVNADKSVTLNGTAVGDAYIYLNSSKEVCNLLKPGSTYTLSGMLKDYKTEGYLRLIITYSDGTIEEINSCIDGNGIGFPITKLVTTVQSIIKIRHGYTARNLIVYPKLEVGNVATPYNPYKTQVYTAQDALGRSIVGFKSHATVAIEIDTATKVITFPVGTHSHDGTYSPSNHNHSGSYSENINSISQALFDDFKYPVGYSGSCNGLIGAPTADWWHIAYLPHASPAGGYGMQIATGFHGSASMHVRSASGTAWGAWARMYTSANITISPNAPSGGVHGDIWLKYS
ncbi:MAG: pyocin knob domain-containing protein, partial [Oscillospiraceae bacterium]